MHMYLALDFSQIMEELLDFGRSCTDFFVYTKKSIEEYKNTPEKILL